MKSKILASVIGVIAIALFSSACATATFTTGRDFDSSKSSQIVKGQTKSTDLIAMVGAPYSKTVDGDGIEHWTWLYTQGKSHAQSYVVSMKVNTEYTGKKLSATLQNGVVTDFSYTEGPISPTAPM